MNTATYTDSGKLNSKIKIKAHKTIIKKIC